MRGNDWAGGMGGGERAKSTFWVGRGVEGGRGERKKGIMHLSKMDVIVIVCSVLLFDVMCFLRTKSLIHHDDTILPHNALLSERKFTLISVRWAR